MSDLHDAGARELLELWALLDADGRMRLLDFAKRLIECATFIGGPLDGQRVTEADRQFSIHTSDHGPDRMAVYELDERGRFVFVDVRAADDVADDENQAVPILKTLGSFDVPSGRLVVADPCYLNHKDLAVVIDNAKPGRWLALVEIGFGVLSLFVFHESDAVRATADDRELAFSVGVDSGRVCVCDSGSIASYEDANLNPGFVADPFGVLVPSGHGDGVYDCRVRECAGEAVSVRVQFIESEVIQ